MDCFLEPNPGRNYFDLAGNAGHEVSDAGQGNDGFGRRWLS